MSAIAPIPKHKRTVFTRTGIGDLGLIDDTQAANLGIPAGIIRLLEGVQGARAGFGRAHIENYQSRMNQLAGLGFLDAVSYAHFIASSFQWIAVQEDRRIVLVRERKALYHHLICQWDPELGIWSVTTAIPKNNMRKMIG